jgi:hypothetical protein
MLIHIHHARRSSHCKFCSLVALYCRSDHATPAQDIAAAEQASLNRATVPELSPSDPNSTASSPSSSAPVTPLDPPPPFAASADPLVDGKHQPDPRPYRPVTKIITSRGTVGRARQVLLSLGKRKRRSSADTGISTAVQLPADHDMPLLSDSPSETELFPSKVRLPFVLV